MVRGDCNVSKAKESSSRNCQFQNWLISADVPKNYTETLVNCKLCEDYILPRFHFTTQSNDIFGAKIEIEKLANVRLEQYPYFQILVENDKMTIFSYGYVGYMYLQFSNTVIDDVAL